LGRALGGVGVKGFITTLSWGEIGDGVVGALPRWRSIVGEYRGTQGVRRGTWC